MAEIKNSFLRSKMNKDLDDRLVPNGEYRDAYNISVGKSEQDDIGALENVLGNNLAVNFGAGLSVIGYLTDEANSRLFVFLTDQPDININLHVPDTALCHIMVWNGTTSTTLVSGSFLNFTKNFSITGVNLVENLLFFTDNRNQPRKINVTKDLGYYTKESDISVAKYNPYEPISLVKTTTSTVLTSPTPTAINFFVDPNLNIKVGMTVISVSSAGGDKINGADFITVAAVNNTAANTEVTLSKAPNSAGDAIAVGDIITFLISTMTNKSGEATWPGDPDYLESKFVRFSYRFKFDDNEYSLMAPFTQIAFVPRQKGFLINGDEDAAYRSTILEFFENNINNVNLIIPFPDFANKCVPNISGNYKIKELDILYKESDAIAVKVLDTLSYNGPSGWVTNLNSFVEYDYQSRKPYRTLPTNQTTRVYDKVPTRALAQEVSGNRVIYGNFKDQYTAPDSLNYRVAVADKQDSVGFDNWIEYPNHSLKQNRNYQVGFVLADKFGRQSSVILSSINTSTSLSGTGAISRGSTIYNPYNTSITDINYYQWFGNALQAVVEETIRSGVNDLPNDTYSEPGLYAVAKGGPAGPSTGFNIFGTVATIVGNVYTFTLNNTNGQNIPALDYYLTGENVDYVKVTNVDSTNAPVYAVTTEGPIKSSIYLNSNNVTIDPKFAYSINSRGWYSYKVVVKQTEQDYYNVYLPGILDGYPDRELTPPTLNPFNIPSPAFPLGEDGKTANIVLINDNINKIPRDLSEVGPDQKQFRSSVQLFGRVNNTATSNIQYFPGISTDTAISISTADDSNMVYQTLSTSGQLNLYQLDTNPLVARLSTANSIGVITTDMAPYLAIYETEPVESLLDIYWETSTVGLISDLNADVANGFDGPSQLSNYVINYNEGLISTASITTPFQVQNASGTDLFVTGSISSNNTAGQTGPFTLVKTTVLPATYDTFEIRLTDNPVFKYDSKTPPISGDPLFLDNREYTITLVFTTAAGDSGTFYVNASLQNIAPSFVSATGVVGSRVLPPINTELGTTGIISTTETNVINGAGAASVNQQQIKWTKTEVNAANISTNYFTINNVTGAITKPTITVPLGVYILSITASDAYSLGLDQLGTGSLNTDTANNNTPLTLQITVGPQPVDTGVVSGCIDNSTSIMSGNSAWPISIANGFSSDIDACWYVSSDVLSNSDLPAAWNSSAQQASQNFPKRIGTATLTKGTVVFSLNMYQDYNIAQTGLSGLLTSAVNDWTIYHRTGASDPNGWVTATDVNDLNQNVYFNTMLLEVVSQGKYAYAQLIFAFDQPGEYAIVATGINTNAEFPTINNAGMPMVWVNSDDLNFSTCVIVPDESGTNYASTTTPQSYSYTVNSPMGSPGCGTGFLATAWSTTPYGEYVSQLYAQAGLTSEYQPANYSSTTLRYPYTVSQFNTTPTPVTITPYSTYKFSPELTSTGAVIDVGGLCDIPNCGSTGTLSSCQPLLRIGGN